MKITSSALFFDFACLSTGMPRPSSVIVIGTAIIVERQADVRGVAVHRLINRVVEDFPDEMMKAGGADTADVHAGTLPNRLEPLENRNVFSGVIRSHGGL